jgi:hypothetical protein
VTFIARPPGICEGCWNNRGGTWIDERGFYCPHTQNLVHRASIADDWKILRNVLPKQATAYFRRAIKAAKAEARRRGIEWNQVDALMRAVNAEPNRSADRRPEQ